jgi:hypothetical protein
METENSSVIKNVYSFQQHRSDFGRFTNFKQSVLKELDSFLKSEFNLTIDLDKNSLELFNERFGFEVHSKLSELDKPSFVVLHHITDCAGKLIEKRKAFEVPFKHVLNYDRHGASKIYTIMLGSLLEYLNGCDRPLIV